MIFLKKDRYFFRSILIWTFVFFTQTSFACSCWHPTPQQLLESGQLILMGKVTHVDEKKSIAYFSVDKLYKGIAESDPMPVRFQSGPGASCGVSLQVGTTLTIFTSVSSWPRTEDQHSINLCSIIPYLSSPQTFQPILDAYAVDVAQAKSMVENNPESIDALTSLIQLYDKNADYLSVVPALEKLLSLSDDQEQGKVLAQIGNAQYRLGRYEDALTALSSALTKRPDISEVRQRRNQVLLKLGRIGELDYSTKNFSGTDLRNSFVTLDFSKQDLSGFNFTQTKIAKSDFTASNLEGADFSEADIYMSNFKKTNLHDAKFRKTTFSTPDFSDADLTRADFSNASVRGANFTNANLVGAKFIKTNGDKVIFTKSNLRLTSLKEVDFYQGDFVGVDLSGLDLSNSKLRGGKFTNARMINTNFSNVLFSDSRAEAPDFRGADLTGARLDGADFGYAIFDCKTLWPDGFNPTERPFFPDSSKECPDLIKTALFSQPAVLRKEVGTIGSNLKGPPITNYDFSGIDLSGANLSGFGFSQINFTGAKFINTDFRNARLGGSDFTGADFTGADLSNASLRGSNFTNARLENAKFYNNTCDAKIIWPE